tara:strand:- start:93 stop:626 length:534 start_codon:yes stop_codon:yes gene_type:complete
MKSLLITLITGLIIQSPMGAQPRKLINNPNILQSCRNYPYKLGVNFKGGRRNSFKLLSTSIVDVLDDSFDMALIAFDEAKLEAKVNIANFLQLTSSPNKDYLNFDKFPISINGRIIKNNIHIENRLSKVSFNSSIDLKGIREVGRCYEKGKYVLTTLEVTNETIRAADVLGNYMKRN